jgi:DNA-binding response OmpR family regulator
MVHGFVNQSGGHLSVHSNPGEGATFELLFPIAAASEAAAGASAQSPASVTILVAEDDPPVRRLIVQALRQQQFTVLEAADGEQARDLARQYDRPIHLLLTDLKMPRLGGVELARWLSFHRPGVRVLFMSGYATAPPVADGLGGGAGRFLQKPFTRHQLLEQIRSLL